MAAYDPAVIKGYLAIVDNPPTNAAKGKAFEDLACYLLNGVPGITITARNEMNTFATEEIDVACKNENDPAGLGAVADFFHVWRELRQTDPSEGLHAPCYRRSLLLRADRVSAPREEQEHSSFRGERLAAQDEAGVTVSRDILPLACPAGWFHRSHVTACDATGVPGPW
jgi:hypothetical protein